LVFVISRQQSKRKVPVNRVRTASSSEAIADYAAFMEALKSSKEAKYYDGVDCKLVHMYVLDWYIPSDHLPGC
jgi:hypothetical protein